MPTRPRPTWKICPVMCWDFSEASQVTSGAMCSGPRFDTSDLSAPRPSMSGMVMRVAAPGETTLQVAPYYWTSSAATRLKPAIPALAAP